jgi:hexosaminidase
VRTRAIILAVVALNSLSWEQEMTPRPATEAKPTLHLMPWPASVQVSAGSGPMIIDPAFTVLLPAHPDRRLEKAAQIFLNDLRRHTGMLALDFHLSDRAPQTGAVLVLSSDHPAKQVPELGEDESYALKLRASRAELSAPTTLGIMRGLATFLQLVTITPQGFAVPSVDIADQPRFAWRGLLVDSSRHFMPLEVIRRNLDGMAAVKLNVFHWHLSDNQGFRLECRRFPKLHELGSDGLYYTQDQAREIVEYAADRGIRVVPEFDMPGHSTSWFVGYPELASAPGPYAVERRWGVFDAAMDPTRESTYKFLDGFIGEVAKLFPDAFFHIGGDEVNGKQWDGNEKIQQFKRAHGFASNADLQAYFNQRLEKILSKHRKIMEGWDEILRPDLPKTIVIQSWRGQQSLADAVRQGYRGLLSSGYYLDLMSPAATHYAVDPLRDGAADLAAGDKQKILGGEACMWGEYVSPENVDSRIWPRLAAIAERLWSPEKITDPDSMYERMERINDWLDAYGLKHNTNYRLMLERIGGSEDASPLGVLADIAEPVKGYSRFGLSREEPTALTPLNRLVDAARPESSAARRFSILVETLVSGRFKPGTEREIRDLLAEWKENDRKLRPLAGSSLLAGEAVPLSESLAALASAGIEALDYLDRGERAPEGWKAQQLAIVEQAFQPKSQLILMVAPAVQKLVQASAGEKPTELVIPKAAR